MRIDFPYIKFPSLDSGLYKREGAGEGEKVLKELLPG